jgi:alkyl sulfatase BDS1-like metallo-beta-lactamase superfamily hydrolase
VARFLSSAWVDEFNRAVADVELAAPGSTSGLAVRDGRFSMCQIVTDGPEGEVRTTLRVHDGRLTMALGDADGADVTIRLTWADALAMAAGELASTDAIAAGRIRVRGDLSVLAEAQATLEAVSPQLVAVRAATGY